MNDSRQTWPHYHYRLNLKKLSTRFSRWELSQMETRPVTQYLRVIERQCRLNMPPRGGGLPSCQLANFLQNRCHTPLPLGNIADPRSRSIPAAPHRGTCSRCHAALKSRNDRCLVFNKFPAFHCRTIAFKARIKFRLKFVQDLTAKLTLSLFFATGLFRPLSTNIPANSGV
jgi:hypothetical protein